MVDLFGGCSTINLLPYDGEVLYLGKVLNKERSDFYFNNLFSKIEWKNDEGIVFGKHIITQRKVAWYGDAGFSYTYSNITKQAIPWTEELLQLKTIAEEKSRFNYNSCLMNLYHDGSEGVSWHSDDEKTLMKNGTIASFSFGAERKFSFKHKKTKDTHSVILEHGGLLLMKGSTQINWLHSLPKSTKIISPRISLTFRRMVVDNDMNNAS